MPDVDLESLLAPLVGDAPCGIDLEHDPDFLAMERAGAGKSEQQFGAKVIPAQGPDWPAVQANALQLAPRTRDLRVAVWLTRSGARMQGLGGAVRGLKLLQGLAERHWAQVHPQLDATDGNDPTARMSALSPLTHTLAGMADLRAASLTGERGSMTLRDIELALGRTEPLPGDTAPTAEGVVKGVAEALAAAPGLAAQMQAGHEAILAVQAVLEKSVKASQAPELGALAELLRRVAEAASRAQGGAVLAPPGTGPAPAPSPAPPAGVIASRDDAIRALERAAEWIERNEPSNPAPLLIRRSLRLMTKNFIDIIRDLVPDSVGQIEKIAGASKT